MNRPLRHLRALLIVGFVGAVPLVVSAAPPPAPAPKAAGWEQAWDASWTRAAAVYRITTASTLTADPACQGDLGFQPRIRALTQAIAERRYGDATRLLAEVHDKSMCLSLEGTRGLEFALAGFLHRGATKLTGADQEAAIFGALNAGTLIFDQLQYTKRSWWLPTMKFHADRIAPIVLRYPKADLGFYAYDFSRNALSRGVDPMAMAASMRDFGNYGDGTCTMLEMAGAGFRCKGFAGVAGMSGGGGGGGGGGGATGGLPSIPSTVASANIACITAAANATGTRGQLGCAAKAVKGMTFDPRTTSPQALLQQGIEGGAPGIRDPRCALSEDAGNGGSQTDPEAAKKEPTTWDKVKDGASKAVGVVIDVVVSAFDQTPTGIGDAKPLASAEGADFVRGFLQWLQKNAAQDKLLSDDEHGYEKYLDQRNNRVTTEPQAYQRTGPDVGPFGGRGGGSCGRGSNAARRAHALYDCITGDSPKPGNRGPQNPLVARHDPEQMQTPATGALACLVNGGSMPRSGFDDPKCATARCAQGALSCPCDKPGPLGNTGRFQGVPIPKLSASTSPNCAEPPCTGPAPAPSGGPLPDRGPKGAPLGPLPPRPLPRP